MSRTSVVALLVVGTLLVPSLVPQSAAVGLASG